MEYLQFIKLFFAILGLILILDGIFLGVFMRNFYKTEFKSIGKFEGNSLAPRWPAALICYLVLAFGLTYFVAMALGKATLLEGLLRGALMGFVTYGIYDLTNLAVVQNWSLRLTLVDWSWGIVLSGIIGLASVYFNRIF